MRACVFGAGAVGGHIAVRLAQAGHDVTVIARGANAEAMRSRGLTLRLPEAEFHATPRVCTEAKDAGPQDVVLVTVKSQSTPAAAPALAALRRAGTSFVFVVNGIPWWYPHGARVSAAPMPDLGFLDPGGRLAQAVGLENVVGSVVFSGNEVVEPGLIVNHSAGSNSITLGEPSGAPKERTVALSRVLEQAGFKSPVVEDIRKAAWSKLIASNLAAFPICTLLSSPLAVFGRDPEIAALARAVLDEGIAVAKAHGIDPQVDPAKVYDAARINSPHKPSMVQDFERGKPLEIDGVLVAVQRFARAAGVPMPRFDALMVILVERAVQAGLYARIAA
jgi:2-dehydropantoate 2-reductase